METRGLLFIPDISGFTRFVNETEISHSRLIIQELLEILINANKIGLEVSEIEGDAILFYKFGDPPALQEIFKQVEQMFCAFHKSLIAYNNSKYCQCNACVSAINLTLKVVTHYGEFTSYRVQNFQKLIGRDIIIAHQLLKNDISQHEYWLVTKKLLMDQSPSHLTHWMEWNSSAKETESGDVEFHFTQLGPLREQVTAEPMTLADLTQKQKALSLTREYDTDLITLFHVTGDFSYRSQWQEGVLRTEEVSHYLPRVGMRYKSIKENGESTIFSSSYAYQEHRIEFTETDETKKSITRSILERISDDKTRFTLEYYIDRGLIPLLLFQLREKQNLANNLKKSLKKLEQVIKQLAETAA